MASIKSIIDHFEKQLNWSLKDKKFIEIPEELCGMDLQFIWDDLRSMGYDVLFEPEYRVKVIRNPTTKEETVVNECTGC